MPTLFPTNSSGSQTVHALRNSDKFGKEFVCDRHKEILFYLPNFVAAANLVSMGVITAELDEVNATELGGVMCATTESYSTLWILPDEIDLAQDLDFRVLFIDEAAKTLTTQTCVVTYQAVTVGTDALVAPATVLDTPIPAILDEGVDIPVWTDWGTIDGGTIGDVPGDDLCNIKIAWTLNVACPALWTLSAQARYYRKFVG
jgi:hypothetical protein